LFLKKKFFKVLLSVVLALAALVIVTKGLSSWNESRRERQYWEAREESDKVTRQTYAAWIDSTWQWTTSSIYGEATIIMKHEGFIDADYQFRYTCNEGVEVESCDLMRIDFLDNDGFKIDDLSIEAFTKLGEQKNGEFVWTGVSKLGTSIIPIEDYARIKKIQVAVKMKIK